MTRYLLARLKEPSTWRGLILLATAAGIHLSPDQIAALSAVGMALAGAVGAFSVDKGGAA